jgi:IS1 family transposase
MKIRIDIPCTCKHNFSMNQLPIAKRVQILQMLCEGVSMRAIARVVDVSFNTVVKLLIDAGQVCSSYHNEKVVGVKAKRVQCDEIWSFTYAKQKNVAKAKAAPVGSGDTWTWTALDADSKLIVSWLVGRRDARHAQIVIDDLKSRLANRVQITTDGLRVYADAIENTFGADVDFAMLVKLYGEPSTDSPERKYSPSVCIGTKTHVISGDPDSEHISTSYVERQNLTMRMHMRRFTRLTNGFSKKFENHVSMVALYTVYYNWIKVHKTLRVTPAMEAGLSNQVCTFEDLAKLIEVATAKPQVRGPYRKKISN